MIIDLQISVPNSADRNEVKEKLAEAAMSAQGITIVTPRRYYIDCDIVGINMRMEATS